MLSKVLENRTGMANKIFCCFLLILSLVCSRQDAFAQLYFDHLTINEGLSHNTVYCILQDRHGYIWMGTKNGLNKYDGYSLEIYRSNHLEGDQSGFIGTNITSLFEDTEGNLWVGTQKKGINFKSRSSDKFINLQSDTAFASINHFEISSIFEDKMGDIWITTVGAGVLRYDPKSNSSVVFNKKNSKLSSNDAFDVIEDQYGTIWVATAGGGLNFMRDGDQFRLSHELLPNSSNMSGFRKKMLLDGDYLWLGTQGTGLYKMSLKDRTYIHFSKENEKRVIGSNVIMDLFKTEDGRLLIATDGKGLYTYNTVTNEMALSDYKVDEKNSLNSNSLLCLQGDRTGNIWIGTYNGGINIYKPNKTWFEFFPPPSANNKTLKHQSILSILQRENGNIWIGTDGSGLYRFNADKGYKNHFFFRNNPSDPNSIAGDVVKTIFEDSQNRLWIGLFGAGLDLYDPKTNSFQHIINWKPNVWSIAQRPDGKLLIATMGSGISVVDPQTKRVSPFTFKVTNQNNLKDHPNIMTVFVDQSGKTWVGSAENGLDILDVNNKHLFYCRYDPLDSFSISDDAIRTIFQDSEGQIWVGTERGGLNRWLGNGRFERVTQEAGLISNSIMGITEDKMGSIWITTFEGISKIDKETQVIQNFDFRTLQNANQFNQEATLRTLNGQLFFGGIYGLNTIRPQKVNSNNQQPKIIFTDLKIFNKSVSVGKLPDGRIILERPIENSSQVWLNYSDQSFSIDFTAVDYTNPLENVFAYKMEGFNTDWQFTTAGQRSATYTNLDPGTYTFKVKHKENLASIIINIKPPYWQTIWFRSLVVLSAILILLAGLYFWVKRRDAAHKRKILQLQNEKLLIITFRQGRNPENQQTHGLPPHVPAQDAVLGLLLHNVHRAEAVGHHDDRQYRQR
jgi:ligand-binding sensor domain-containing protein